MVKQSIGITITDNKHYSQRLRVTKAGAVTNTMIIYDTDVHKIDVTFDSGSPIDGQIWTNITIFHKKSNTEWTSKVVRLNQSSARELAERILQELPK